MERTLKLLFLVLSVLTNRAVAIDIVDRRAPGNFAQPMRTSTMAIILHTTEGDDASSLATVRNDASCNYLVLTNGTVVLIVDDERKADHAGMSMWNGVDSLNTHTLGIEIVGYHDKEPTWAQKKSLKELLPLMQAKYDVPDCLVLTHSMIAYDVPNKGYPDNHRGRKSCAMLFAEPALREKIGLDSGPCEDPDVKAGRLHKGDPRLFKRLYGKSGVYQANIVTPSRSPWRIIGEYYTTSRALYIYPDGTRRRGNEIKDWTSVPVGTQVTLSTSR